MKFTGSKEEAMAIARLVNAWSAAQTVVEQLQPVLASLGMLKPNGRLDQEKALAAGIKARESNQQRKESVNDE